MGEAAWRTAHCAAFARCCTSRFPAPFCHSRTPVAVAAIRIWQRVDRQHSAVTFPPDILSLSPLPLPCSLPPRRLEVRNSNGSTCALDWQRFSIVVVRIAHSSNLPSMCTHTTGLIASKSGAPFVQSQEISFSAHKRAAYSRPHKRLSSSECATPCCPRSVHTTQRLLALLLDPVDQAVRGRVDAPTRRRMDESWPLTSPSPASSGRMLSASFLPSSTPHWSYELTFHTTPCTKILCS